MTENNSYNAASIRSLTPRQHLLKRMSLTFGPETAVDGANDFSSRKAVALREILDNGLDEIRAGYGQHLRLKFYPDRSFEVQDSGRGIPVDIGKDANNVPASGIYLSMGVLQSGGKFTGTAGAYSSGLNGLGGSAVVAVSKRSDITVFRNKKKYELSFQDGVPGNFDGEGADAPFTPLKDLTKVKSSKDTRSAAEKEKYPTGTIVRCWLDESVFSTSAPYDDQDIIERLRGTAFLVPELHAEVINELNMIEDPATGEKSPQHEEFHFPDGMASLVDYSQPDQKITDTVTLSAMAKYTEHKVPVLQKNGEIVNMDIEREAPVEVAFRYGDGYEPTMHSFVNTINTKLGGVHEEAFEKAFVLALNEKFYGMQGGLKKADQPAIIDDFREGLTVVLSVQVSEPNFTNQAKEMLSGREVQKAIQNALKEAFTEWAKSRSNAETVKILANKVLTAAKNRQKAREQRDLHRKNSKITSASLPTKLLDCEMAGEDGAELYICEGDSAISSLKQARDGRINALLGIRGKIINAHKNSVKSVMDNTEVQDIITTLGAGSGAAFDIDKMRYDRVFMAVDADPDGNGIACLLYALFWHLFRPMVEKGMLYKVETPLFAISVDDGKNSMKYYANDDRERDSIVADLKKRKKKFAVTRLKGLGEMQAVDLERTAIDPQTRVITQVTVDDIKRATESLELIFGKDTESRKRWIETYEVDDERIDA